MLLGKQHRRNERVSVALVFLAAKLDQNFVVLIEDETVLRAIDAKLVEMPGFIWDEKVK